MYSKIVLCLTEKEDEVLERQIEMLKERHHAELEQIDSDDAVNYISECEAEILFISDDEELLVKAKDKGIAANSPKKMKESYAKAMEMLMAMGNERIVKAVRRITEMEIILDETTRRIENVENSPEEFLAYQPEIRRLERYYSSKDWKDDYAMDEEGVLPKSLKRGVLSEDGINDVLEQNKELLDKLGGGENV